MKSLGLAAADVKVAVMPPAGSAVKSPFPQFGSAKKDGNGEKTVPIDFDAMCGGRSPRDNLPLAAYLAFISRKPLRVFSSENDRQARGRMIMQSSAVV